MTMSTSASPRIGFIGLGLMGKPMSLHLLRQFGAICVWNRSPLARAALAAQGAEVAASAAELTRRCDIVLLCVSDDAAVAAVCRGEHGVFAGAHPGLLVVDHSSITPALTRQLSTELAAHGGHWVDAPVSGGVVGAQAGSLVVMAGGQADAVAATTPVMQAYAQRITHMGDSGAGQVSKLCNQLIVAANSLLIAEAVALAASNGVNASALPAALAGGFADSKPFQLLTPRMATHQFEPVQWKVDTLLKDLSNACALGHQAQLVLPVAEQARARLLAHAQQGHGQRDLSSIIELLMDAQGNVIC